MSFVDGARSSKTRFLEKLGGSRKFQQPPNYATKVAPLPGLEPGH